MVSVSVATAARVSNDKVCDLSMVKVSQYMRKVAGLVVSPDLTIRESLDKVTETLPVCPTLAIADPTPMQS